MILPLPEYTLLHVALSLVGIVAGLVMVGGMMSGRRFDGWIATFLVTTFLTNLTSFGFLPIVRILPSHILGGLSLLILPAAIYAFYGKHLEGRWRQVFSVTAIVALYFNFFVLITQLFSKVPGLIAVAPTQQAPAFGLTQLAALGMFVALGRSAVRGFRTA